jgi:hypothetical protein
VGTAIDLGLVVELSAKGNNIKEAFSPLALVQTVVACPAFVPSASRSSFIPFVKSTCSVPRLQLAPCSALSPCAPPRWRRRPTSLACSPARQIAALPRRFASADASLLRASAAPRKFLALQGVAPYTDRICAWIGEARTATSGSTACPIAGVARCVQKATPTPSSSSFSYSVGKATGPQHYIPPTNAHLDKTRSGKPAPAPRPGAKRAW